MTTQSPDMNNSRVRSIHRSRAISLFALGVAFLAVAGLAAAGLWLRYDDVLRDGRRTVENLTTVLSTDLEDRIRGVEDVLRELASFSRFIGGPSEAGQEWMTLLRTAAAGRYGFEALLVTNASGRVTFSSLPILMGESRADGVAFEMLSADPTNDALTADPAERSSNDSSLVVPLARVIRTPAAEFEGMAIANLAPEQLRDFYAAANVRTNAIIWLLMPSDSVLLREPPSATPRDEAWPSALATKFNPGETGATSGPITPSGPPYIHAYSSLPGTGITVAVSLARADLLAPWWNEVYAVVTLAGLVGIFLLVAAIVIIRAVRAVSPTSEAYRDST